LFIIANRQKQLIYLLKPDYRKSFINSLGQHVSVILWPSSGP